MLDILIMLILIVGFLIGLKRGLIVQAMHLISFIIALIVARMYYKPLAQKFVLWIPYPGFNENATMSINLDALDVDRTFYRILAFALIFFIVKFALQIVASIFDFITYLPVLKSVNRILGAVFGFIEVYLLIFFALYLFALIPIEKIQSILDGAFLPKRILENTPFLTSLVKEWWYIYVNN